MIKKIFNFFFGWIRRSKKYEPLPEMADFTDKRDESLKLAYDFFLKELCIYEQRDIIDEVKLVTEQNWKKQFDKDSCGYCQYTKKPDGEKKVDIFVKENGTCYGAVEVLAHEMVHAQQFIEGRTELIDGKLYHNGKLYKDRPWESRECEAEAVTMQHKLTAKFISFMNKKEDL